MPICDCNFETCFIVSTVSARKKMISNIENAPGQVGPLMLPGKEPGKPTEVIAGRNLKNMKNLNLNESDDENSSEREFDSHRGMMEQDAAYNIQNLQGYKQEQDDNESNRSD